MKTRSKIIHAATELFSELGYRGSTTKAIAERAGVSEMTVFRQFGNKIGVLEEVQKVILSNQKEVIDFDPEIYSDIISYLRKITEIEIRNIFNHGMLVLKLMLEAQSSEELMNLYKNAPKSDVAQKLTENIIYLQDSGVIRKDMAAFDIVEYFLNMVFMHVTGRLLLQPERNSSVDELIDDSVVIIDIFWHGIRTNPV